MSEDPTQSLGNCAYCHYKNSGRPYSPDIPEAAERYQAQFGSPIIDPFAVIGDRAWNPPYGGSAPSTLTWVLNFRAAMPYGKPKPLVLQEALQKWLDDGAY